MSKPEPFGLEWIARSEPEAEWPDVLAYVAETTKHLQPEQETNG